MLLEASSNVEPFHRRHFRGWSMYIHTFSNFLYVFEDSIAAATIHHLINFVFCVIYY